MGEHQRGAESPENLSRSSPRAGVVGQRAVGNSDRKKFSAEPSCGGCHFPPADRNQVRNGFGRLSFVSATKDADSHGRPNGASAGQRSGTKQFRVIGMSHYRENTLIGKI
jgi:hypothetical protein